MRNSFSIRARRSGGLDRRAYLLKIMKGMNLKKPKFHRAWSSGGLLLATGWLASEHAAASPVLMGPPPVNTAPLSLQQDEANNEMNVFGVAGLADSLLADPFHYGPVTLHPHVSYSLNYAIGVKAETNSVANGINQQLSPGVTADIGEHWTVDYTPTILFYSDRQFHDGVNQSASINGSTHYEDWSLGISQGISSTSDPLTETAAQTDQQQYSTALSAGYAFNDKWTANMGLNQSIALVSGLQNSYNWQASGGVSYQFWPRFNVGVNLSSGYTKVDTEDGTGNPDTVNESLSVDANWRATDKISFQFSVGAESQQFLASGYGTSVDPIFSASIQYQPFPQTQLSLTASRTVSSSDYYTSAQSSEGTSISLNLNQRILVKYNLTLGVSYSTTDFTSTFSGGTLSGTNGIVIIPGGGTVRSDNTYSFNASIGRSFWKRANWSVNYVYTDNGSTIGGYGQNSSQIGFQLGYSY